MTVQIKFCGYESAGATALALKRDGSAEVLEPDRVRYNAKAFRPGPDRALPCPGYYAALGGPLRRLVVGAAIRERIALRRHAGLSNEHPVGIIGRNGPGPTIRNLAAPLEHAFDGKRIYPT